MIDIKSIRGEPQRFVEAARVKGFSVDISALLAVDATEALETCTAPILYLRARRDRLVGRRCLEAILRVRDVEVREFDTPHLLLQTAPVAAWEPITVFL